MPEAFNLEEKHYHLEEIFVRTGPTCMKPEFSWTWLKYTVFFLKQKQYTGLTTTARSTWLRPTQRSLSLPQVKTVVFQRNINFVSCFFNVSDMVFNFTIQNKAVNRLKKYLGNPFLIVWAHILYWMILFVNLFIQLNLIGSLLLWRVESDPNHNLNQKG